MSSYLQLTLPEGKESVRREFIAVEAESSVEEGIERWIEAHPSMNGRKRNRDKVARALRGSIIGARIARPTSYWREIAERNGSPFPAPVGSPKARRR